MVLERLFLAAILAAAPALSLAQDAQTPNAQQFSDDELDCEDENLTDEELAGCGGLAAGAIGLGVGVPLAISGGGAAVVAGGVLSAFASGGSATSTTSTTGTAD